MKKMLTLFAVSLFTLACATNDYDEPQRPRGTREPSRAGMGGDGGEGLNIIPTTDWWHQPAISSALNLTNDQYAALDRIAADRSDEISRLRRDSETALRDLRETINGNQPSTADITTAAQRVRAIRDSLFDRQVQMIAAERQVLTQQQWQTLQTQLQSERMDRRDDYGGRRGGRRGGMGGGRGRWPGF